MKKSRRQALGQHFLKNPRILNKIVSCISPEKHDLIIEIGAGEGALTYLLAEKAGKIIALEKDASLITSLTSRPYPNVVIIHADFLKIELANLAEGGKFKLVGNLPYSLSSRILYKIISERENITEWHFLLQKEVAERITAFPGSKKYAPLSILFQNDFSTRIHFIIAPGSFSPPPQVDSALISGKARKSSHYSIANRNLFQKFIHSSFRQRRKKIINNLKSVGIPLSQIITALNACGVEPQLRPEQITLEQYVKLFNYLYPQKREA